MANTAGSVLFFSDLSLISSALLLSLLAVALLSVALAGVARSQDEDDHIERMLKLNKLKDLGIIEQHEFEVRKKDLIDQYLGYRHRLFVS